MNDLHLLGKAIKDRLGCRGRFHEWFDPPGLVMARTVCTERAAFARTKGGRPLVPEKQRLEMRISLDGWSITLAKRKGPKHTIDEGAWAHSINNMEKIEGAWETAHTTVVASRSIVVWWLMHARGPKGDRRERLLAETSERSGYAVLATNDYVEFAQCVSEFTNCGRPRLKEMRAAFHQFKEWCRDRVVTKTSTYET